MCISNRGVRKGAHSGGTALGDYRNSFLVFLMGSLKSRVASAAFGIQGAKLERLGSAGPHVGAAGEDTCGLGVVTGKLPALLTGSLWQ